MRFAPYQLFFPLGVLSSLIAVLVWILTPLRLFEAPALFIHSKLIFGGFLWSFITGFLMTAVPKMTGTRAASPLEVGISLVLVLLLIVQSLSLQSSPFYFTHAALMVWLSAFAARRFFARVKPVPVFFSHVGLAFLSGLLGCYYMIKGPYLVGVHLYHVGALLLLVLGIGTRFFAFLSGLPSVFETLGQRAHLAFHLHGASVVALLWLAGKGYALAYLGLTLVCLSYLFFIWRIQRPTDRPSAMKWGVRLVALSLPVSFFLCWLQPAAYITWLHFLFIGSFAVITYSVATRVTLAHGSYSTDLETRSKTLWLVILFLTLSLAARLFYGLSTGPMKPSLLHAAAFLWVAAILTWSYGFLVKIFVPGPQSKPSC